MPISFFNSNGDTGAADAASVKPIANGDPVDQAFTNRPTENLRLRTEFLKRGLEEQATLTAADALLLAETTAGGKVDVGWDGPFVPGNAFASAGTLGSGRMWLGTADGSTQARLKLYLANAPAVSKPAQVSFSINSVPFVFKTTATAAQGSNSLRVAVAPSITSGADLARAAWSSPSVSVGAIPSATAPGAVPSVPTTASSMLTVEVRSDGTTTVASIQAAVAGAVHPSGFSLSVTSTSATSATIGTISETKYFNLAGGVDAAVWTLSKDDLNAFFDAGAVNTTTVNAISVGQPPASQTVKLASVAALVPGATLHVGTVGNVEDVVVTAVDAVNSTVTGVFTQTRSPGVQVVCAPNRLRAGDTLVAVLGSGRSRLAHGTTLTASDLTLPRHGTISQDTPVIPIASCPVGSERLLYANQVIDKGSSILGATSDYVHLSGDLTGTAITPRVVGATKTSTGAVRLNDDPPMGSAPTVALVAADGKVKGDGLTAVTANTALAVGTGTNDNSVTIGRSGHAVSVPGDAAFSGGVALSGAVAVSGTATFSTAPVFSTQVNFPSGLTGTTASVSGNVSLTGTTPQSILKTGAGTLTLGPTASGASLFLATAGSDKWEVDATGHLNPRLSSNTVRNLPAPTQSGDAATKSYVDGFPTRTNTFTALQTFSAPPECSVEPASATRLANKSYVDAAAAGAKTYSDTKLTELRDASIIWTNQHLFNIAPTCSQAPSTDFSFTNRGYVTGLISGLLNNANTWNGINIFATKQSFLVPPECSQDPGVANALTRKSYVDNTVSSLLTTGNTWSGTNTFSTKQTFSVAPECAQDPSATTALTRKSYVDTAVTGARNYTDTEIGKVTPRIGGAAYHYSFWVIYSTTNGFSIVTPNIPLTVTDYSITTGTIIFGVTSPRTFISAVATPIIQTNTNPSLPTGTVFHPIAAITDFSPSSFTVRLSYFTQSGNLYTFAPIFTSLSMVVGLN